MVQSFKNTKDVKEPSQLKQLQDYIVSDSEAQPRNTKWVTMLEELPNIIPTALVCFLLLHSSSHFRTLFFTSQILRCPLSFHTLYHVCILFFIKAYLRSQPSQKIKEKHFVSIITEWAIFSLNMDNVCSLPLAVNIRLLKAGIKLTSLLATSSDDYQR